MFNRRAKPEERVERRGAQRADVRCEVEFLCGSVLYVATAENLSVSGAFVATEVGVFYGQPVDVKLTLDDASDPIKVVGKIVRLARRRDERPGFGLEFESIDDVTRRRLERAVAGD